ncbi:lysophospholipid acyltransferase family protein [Fodinicola feengrottensis]|uniref:Lysophospholipid acyltransferase family protein n=2 Tax=Fodinicola feengrottensis TaxID=435914 RepID=A0ABN2FPJ5_9ACTN
MPRRIGRLLAALLLILSGFVFSPLLVVLSRRRRLAAVRIGARLLLHSLGIALTIRGRLARPGGQAVLYVGNHTSWIDILAMIAVQPCRHVAKSGVRGWPVIGPIATAAGTVWMDRDKLSTLPAAVERVARALRISGAVAGFPEGTTWCGRERGPFKPAIFEAAVRAGALVQPVALQFADGRTAFVGDDTLVASVWRTVSLRRPRLVVLAITPLDATQVRSRGALADATATAIAGALRESPVRTPATAPTRVRPALPAGSPSLA